MPKGTAEDSSDGEAGDPRYSGSALRKASASAGGWQLSPGFVGLSAFSERVFYRQGRSCCANLNWLASDVVFPPLVVIKVVHTMTVTGGAV